MEATRGKEELLHEEKNRFFADPAADADPGGRGSCKYRRPDEGYGAEKGIPQLILAGASVDDVFVIVMFSVFTGLAQGEGISPVSFMKIPVSILTGILILLFLKTGHVSLSHLVQLTGSMTQ